MMWLFVIVTVHPDHVWDVSDVGGGRGGDEELISIL